MDQQQLQEVWERYWFEKENPPIFTGTNKNSAEALGYFIKETYNASLGHISYFKLLFSQEYLNKF